MTSFFRQIMQMSISASYVILAVLLCRLLLKHAPKKYSYLLWSVVGFRLCFPFSVSSVLSIFNLTLKRKGQTVIDLTEVPVTYETAEREILELGVPAATEVFQETMRPAPVPEVLPSGPTDPALTPEITEIQPSVPSVAEVQSAVSSVNLEKILCILWIAGIAAMLIYSIVSYMRVKKQANCSLPLRDNIRRMETRTPFILGLVHPTIYLPFGLNPMTENIAVSHERHHLHRKDHLVKLFSYLLLCLHWFNPLCWIAYFEMGKDMEMSCDEYVLSHYREIAKDYGTALLSFSTGHRFSLASPLAFGESSIKERILNVMRYRKASRIVTVLAAAVCIVALAACGTNGTQPSEPSPVSDESGTSVKEIGGEEEIIYRRLFPNDGTALCVFEQKEDPASVSDRSVNYNGLLVFDYERASFRRIGLGDYRFRKELTPAAPVLWEKYAVAVECGAYRCNAYTLCAEDTFGKLFLADRFSGEVTTVSTYGEWYLFGSPVFCREGDSDHLFLTGCTDPEGETVLLQIDIRTGETECLGTYQDPERKTPVNGMPFSVVWDQYDGYTYAYLAYDMQKQSLFRKITASKADFECLIEDCYPEEFQNPYTGSFCVLGNTVYYYGVCQGESKIPTVFCFDLDSGSIIRRERESGESLMPVDQYGEYLVLAGPEQVRNGVPLPADGVRMIGKEQYMENDSSGIPFAEESDIVRIDGQSPQMSSSMTDLSWITENGAVGFYNSLYTPEKQTTDILAYYDFESLTYKLFELPEMIRGRTNLHKLYLLDNLVIGFSARAEEQGGNNHIIDDSIDSHFVIWNTTNNNLKDVRLDPDYYLYAHKLMISANVDNAFYVLGCYKQDKDVLLLKINTDDGSIENLGVYEEKKNSFGAGKQGVFIGYEDGNTYYKFVEQTGDDIKRSLIRVDGTNEECIIEDMFPGNISSPGENMYFLSDGMLYYYGIDRDKIEGYVFEANLHTGELQYRIATEEEGSRKGVSRHGEYLIFGPPINPSGILSEDSLLAIKAEDYIENPVFIRFASAS